METTTIHANEYEHEHASPQEITTTARGLANLAMTEQHSRRAPASDNESPLEIRYADGSILRYIVTYHAHSV